MAGAGAAAVRSEDGFRLVTANQLIDTAAVGPIGAVADDIGFVPERFGDIIGNDDDFFNVRPPDPEQLPQFDVPAGYKQCTGNANHTYDIDSSYTTCPHDSHPLVVVYLND